LDKMKATRARQLSIAVVVVAAAGGALLAVV
jgi:hypothetical protein